MDFIGLFFFFFFSCMIMKRCFFGTLKDLRKEQESTELFVLPKSKQSLNRFYFLQVFTFLLNLFSEE